MSETDDQSIEQEIQEKDLTAPRVTPEDIEDNIVSEYYFTAMDGVVGEACSHCEADRVLGEVVYTDGSAADQSLHLLTFCVIVLKNGFTLTGESACASPENFSAEIGRKIARTNAVNKI